MSSEASGGSEKQDGELDLLKRLTTEARNPASENIDEFDSLGIVRLMNDEDARIADAVKKEEHQIAAAISRIAAALSQGGRLIYLGAGTSGRLGVLDASECPPTFNTRPEMVVGVIAGGEQALTRSIEGAEDHPEYAERDLKQIDLAERDVLVGIATSGRTPYVIGGLQYAQSINVYTVGLACTENAALSPYCDTCIQPVVGPEVISGSTRLKAGTATKMVLNMLTTGTMVLLGKTFGNLMVDLRASNSKLTDRARRIACMLTDLDSQQAQQMLDACDGELKTAIVAHCRETSPDEARKILADAQQQLRVALDVSGCDG